MKANEESNNIEIGDKKMSETIPLNQILYGPPGTGKTYNTIITAMEIINGKEYSDKEKENYKKIKDEFNDYKEKGRIEFITFHQSYSYEEFVEGIKPDIQEWGEENPQDVKYIGKDGIFKKICREAKRNLYSANKKKKADFNTIYGMFKEKYENGSDFSNLINIQHETNNLIYHYGKQKNDRKIDINKIKEIFESAKKYSSAVEFNKDYKGNSALKGYYFNFYKELIKIKEDYEDENRIQNGINNNFPNYVLIIDEIN
ncbi:MAG: hypothetical protein LUH05_07880, partial [Candidatus Gastranaerophilales bacterium]|nr:hypothetical protein [Candidatus Gastranaerophilales bacterium]